MVSRPLQSCKPSYRRDDANMFFPIQKTTFLCLSRRKLVLTFYLHRKVHPDSGTYVYGLVRVGFSVIVPKHVLCQPIEEHRPSQWNRVCKNHDQMLVCFTSLSLLEHVLSFARSAANTEMACDLVLVNLCTPFRFRGRQGETLSGGGERNRGGEFCWRNDSAVNLFLIRIVQLIFCRGTGLQSCWGDGREGLV